MNMSCKCPNCNVDMILDDVDYNFKGNQNNYWCCPKCKIYCFEKIRFGKSFSKEYETIDD